MAQRRGRAGHPATVARQLAASSPARQGERRGLAAWLPARLGVGALALSSTSLLAACGTEGTIQTADTCTSTDKSDTEKAVVFSQLAPLHGPGRKSTTLENFEKESGIKVTYTTDINGNNEFFAKVRNQLGACQPVGRDIFVLTDWMAAKVLDLGWLQSSTAPTCRTSRPNLVDSLKSPSSDPNRNHSVPWQSGLTGIAYNSKYTGEVSSFEELVTRADLKGKI